MWNDRRVATIFVFLLVFLIFSLGHAIFGKAPEHDDHYFHIKYAYLLRTQGWNVVDHFDWIYLSRGAENGGRYEVNLFQLMLVPFTYCRDLVIALQIADVFFASVIVTMFYAIMRKEGLYHALFFALLLVGITSVADRLLLGRAFVLTIGLVFVEMYYAIHERGKLLGMMSFLHVLIHQSTYFLPFVVVGIVEFSRYVMVRKVDLKNCLYTFFGVILGMAFFPGFPESLFLWIKNLIDVQQYVSYTESTALGGSEMVSKSLMMNSFEHMAIIIGCFVCVAVFSHIWKSYGDDLRNRGNNMHMIWMLALCVLTVVFFGGSIFVAGRLYDYVLPSLIMLMAFVITTLVHVQILSHKSIMDRGFTLLLWVILCGMGTFSFMHVYTESRAFDITPILQAGRWIQEHSTKGEKVYIHNWSYFTVLFFANHDNVYSMGIEPSTLKRYDESLYWKYHNIFAYKYYCETKGDCKEELRNELQVKRKTVDARNQFKKENSERIITSIKNDFGAQIIFSNSDEFSGMIALSPEMIKDRYDTQSADGEMRYTVFILW